MAREALVTSLFFFFNTFIHFDGEYGWLRFEDFHGARTCFGLGYGALYAVVASGRNS